MLYTDKEIKDKIIDSIETLKNNFTNYPYLQEHIRQRMDELALLYSSMFDITFKRLI